MSIALAALDHDPRRIHRGPQGLEGTRVTLYGKQGWSNLAVFFFFFLFFARGSFALDAFASVRTWSFVSYAAHLRGSCGLYDPRTNERPIDQSILSRRSAK